MKSEIVKKEDAQLVNTDVNPSTLLQMAVQQNLDIDKLEKLMDLQAKWEERQARKNFFQALSRFQSIVPELKKDKQIKFETRNGGKTSYKFAPLGQIEAQIKEPMFVCGLSKRWEMGQESGAITCTCIITHLDGHSERTLMVGAKDDSGNKNQMQQNASAITYLQRYTLIAALGLTTADEDNDSTTSSDGDSGGNESNHEQTPDLPWLNEKTPEWDTFVVNAINNNIGPNQVLDTVKKSFRINKRQTETILAMKPTAKAETPAAKQEPVNKDQPAAKTTPSKPQRTILTAMDMAEWEAKEAEYNSASTPPADRFKKGQVTDTMRIYNNNVQALKKKSVGLEAIQSIYDLAPEVIAHYQTVK